MRPGGKLICKVRLSAALSIMNSAFFVGVGATNDNDYRYRQMITRLVTNATQYQTEDPDILAVPSTYNHSDNIDFGRLYAKDGLQMAPGWFRKLLTAGLYHDIDIVNCAPTILRQWNERNGISSPLLKCLVDNRDGVFELIGKETGTDDRDKIKKSVNTCIFLGNYKEHMKATSKWLDMFSEECKITGKSMFNHSSNADLVILVKSIPSKDNPIATVRSWLIQKIESQIINAAEEIIARTHKIGINMMDGLMVERQEGVEPPDLGMVNTYCRNKTGWDCRFIYKPTDPTPDDFSHVVPDDDMRLPEWFPDAYRDRIRCYTPTNHGGHINDILFEDETRVYVINAGMNMGKSTAISGIDTDTLKLEGLLQRSPHLKRILVVTARQQQANTAECSLGRHGFMNYLNCEDGVPLKDYDRLIIQYESLHRLMRDGKLPDYDLIIIDEYRGVCAQKTSPTNGLNLLLNSRIMETFLSHYKCLLMDADILSDRMVMDVLTKFVPPNEIQIDHYTHQRLPRSFSFIDKSTWVKRVLDAAITGKKIMIPFRAKSDMIATKRLIEEACEELGLKPRIKAISSDSPTCDIDIFKNINEAMEEIDILMFTSKCTVGADIQVYFDKVFVHADSAGGPTPLQIFQMVGRARKVRDEVIEVCISSAEGSKPSTRNQLLVEIQNGVDRSGRVMKHMTAVRQSQSLEKCEDGFRWSPSWLVECAANSECERQQIFAVDFLRYVVKKKFGVSVYRGELDNGESKKKVKAVKTVIKEEANDRMIESTKKFKKDMAESDFPSLFATHTYYKLEGRIKRNEVLSAEERDMLRIARLVKEFKYSHMATVGAEDLVWGVTHAEEVKNGMLLCNVFDHGFNDSNQPLDWVVCHDASKLTKSQLPEFTKHNALACISFVRILQQLGVKDLFVDGGTNFPAPSIRDAVSIKNNILDMMKHEKRRVGKLKVPKKDDGLVKWVMPKLAKEFVRCGFVLTSAQKRKEGGVRVREYNLKPLDATKALYEAYHHDKHEIQPRDIMHQSHERVVLPSDRISKRRKLNDDDVSDIDFLDDALACVSVVA